MMYVVVYETKQQTLTQVAVAAVNKVAALVKVWCSDDEILRFISVEREDRPVVVH